MLDTKVEDLLESVQASNALRRAGLETVQDLLARGSAFTALQKGIGDVAMMQIRRALDSLGLEWTRDGVPPNPGPLWKQIDPDDPVDSAVIISRLADWILKVHPSMDLEKILFREFKLASNAARQRGDAPPQS